MNNEPTPPNAPRRPKLDISPKPLTQQIADHIRSEIIHDQLKPGEWIREKGLSEQFQISRTPLREALQILATQRLVDIIPNRGAVAAAPSADEILNMLQVYVRLDVFAGELACVNAVPDDHALIRHHLAAMTESYKAGDRYAYFDANQAFHLSIAAASHNPVLVDMHSHLNLRLYRTRYLGVLRAEDWARAHQEHAPIARALFERDAPTLARLLEKHLEFALRTITPPRIAARIG